VRAAEKVVSFFLEFNLSKQTDGPEVWFLNSKNVAPNVAAATLFGQKNSPCR